MKHSRSRCLGIVCLFLVGASAQDVVTSSNLDQNTCTIDKKDTTLEASFSSTETKKLNILSLDGGGSRGVMEAMLLDDIMRMVTMMKAKPQSELLTQMATMNNEARKSLQQEQEEKNKRDENVWFGRIPFFSSDRPKVEQIKNLGFRKKLEELEEKELIHPTEIFDMIAGTSTGSLIAFALVAGKKNNESSDLDVMSVNEVIEMYRIAISNVFVEQGMTILSSDSWMRLCVFGKPFAFFVCKPQLRSQAGLEKELDKVFGERSLHEITPSASNNDCIAAAIASEFNEDELTPDTLVIFDTNHDTSSFHLDDGDGSNNCHIHNSFKCVLIKDVLLASSDAPVYFKTPKIIGNKSYVDGGLTGNCPLATALPRLLEIYKDHNPELQTVISIAPPIEKLEKTNDKIRNWLPYLIARLSDGYNLGYTTSKRIYSTATFARISPGSKEAMQFKMDETNVDEMMFAIQKERIEDPNYYDQILDIAALTVSRLPDVEFRNDFLTMMHNIIKDHLIPRKKIEIALFVAKNILKRLDELSMRTSMEDERENTRLFWSIQFQFLVGKLNWSTSRQRFNESTAAYEKCLDYLDNYKNQFGEDANFKPDQQKLISVKIDTLDNLGIISQMAKKYETSNQYFDDALKLFEDKSPRYAAIMINKVGNLKSMSDYYHTQILESSNIGDERDEIMKRLDDAIEILNQSIQELTKDEDTKLANKEKIAWVRKNLGKSYYEKGDYEKALEQYGKSLQLLKEIYGIEAKNEEIASVLTNIGSCHLNRKTKFKSSEVNYGNALRNLNKSLVMMSELHGEENNDDVLTALIYEKFARYFMENKNMKLDLNLNKALMYANKSYQMRKRIFGDETNPSVAGSHQLLSSIEKSIAEDSNQKQVADD